jgi:hypothetical protein
MPLPEYVLLVSLATGIQAHRGADSILSIGPEVITQPNGGAPVVLAGCPKGVKCSPNAAVTSPQATGQHIPKVFPGVTVTSPATVGPPVHPPLIRAPIIRTPVVR